MGVFMSDEQAARGEPNLANGPGRHGIRQRHGLFSGPAIERSNGLCFKKCGRVLTATHGRRRDAARSTPDEGLFVFIWIYP